MRRPSGFLEVAHDRWNSGPSWSPTSMDEFGTDETAVPRVIAIGQGFQSMSAPTRELEKLLLAGKIRHGGNPVARWMAANVAVRQDPAGNLKPDKKKSSEKIDGIVALIMAIGRAMVRPSTPDNDYTVERLEDGDTPPRGEKSKEDGAGDDDAPDGGLA
jgi:phage terminase large subunit-like protein